MARYVFTDLHGRYDLWEQIRDYIKPEDEVYCLGDCGDRGPDGYRIMTEVLGTSNITYLKGNHEDMMIDAYKRGDNMTWFWNGGKTTKKQMEKALNYDHNMIEWFIRRINRLPTRINLKIGDNYIILTHAGVNPWAYDEWDETRMWDRNHIRDNWKDGYEDTYVIHGHTPVMLDEYKPDDFEIIPSGRTCEYGEIGIMKYAGGHKINLDVGAVWEGVAALFDLDTFEVKYFYDKANS